MLTTTTAAERTSAAPTKPTVVGDITTRLAGAGAITFASVVALQNVIRGASAPGNGASSTDVLRHYADHRTITFVLIATYVVSGLGLATFLGGAMRQLIVSGRRGWALTGLVGAISVMALFAVVVGAEQAVSVVAHGSHPAAAAVQALWAFHNSVFAVLDLSIAIALIGLSRAGVAAGITPRVYGWLAPVGAAMLLVGTFAGPAIAGGEAMPLFGVTGVGFVVWLSFVLTTGIRMIRSQEA